MKIKHFFLLLIIVGGIVLRVLPALLNGVWLDEVGSFLIVNRPFSDLIWGIADPVHPPLYYMFLQLWANFSRDPFFLRLPSLIFASVSIFLAYRLGEILQFNKLFSFMAAFFLAFSPFFIQYSWQARMYSQELFFLSLSLYFLFRFFNEGRGWFLFFFALANIGGFLTDYGFFWYILSLHLVGLWARIKKFFLTLLITDGLLLLWLPVFMGNFNQALGFIGWIKRPDLEIVLKTIYSFFGFQDGYSWLIPYPRLQLALSLIILFSFLMVARRLGKARHSFFLFLIAATFVLPLVLAFVLSCLLPSSIFQPQHLTVVPLALIFINALVFSSLFLAKRRFVKVAAGFVLIVFMYLNFDFYLKEVAGVWQDKYGGRYFREAAWLIKREADLGKDYLVFLPSHFRANFDYYYFFPFFPRFRAKVRDYKIINDSQDLRRWGEKGRYLWVIVQPWVDVQTLADDYPQYPFLRYLSSEKPYKVPIVYRVAI